MPAKLLFAPAIIGILASTVFLGLAIIATLRHRRLRRLEQQRPSPPLKPVSVLKPMHGLEPQLRENIESFFRQDYPEFELVFCARTRDDAALKLVDEIAPRYPGVKVKVIASGEPPCSNAKVYSLQQMLEAASHDVLVISDSDVEVTPNYLREVAAPLMDPARNIGVVTCLYRGVPTGGLWSQLEALGMSVEMTSGVVIAGMLEDKMRFALGPTMATRKDVVAKFGGFARMAEYCSDDYLLGNWAAAAGYEVVISPHVIDHIVLGRDWRASWAHQVRWMKSTRFSRPKGHFGTGLTFSVPFGILALATGALTSEMTLGFSLFAWSVVNRLIQSVVVGWGVVKDPRAVSYVWLYPLRDLLGFFLWMASYGSNVIDWRGHKYRMVEGGRMVRVKER